LIVFIGIAIALFLVGLAYVSKNIAPTDKVKGIANAIAKAEGFFLNGSEPQRAHNPGDLELGDIGNGLLFNKTIFATDADGWNALYHQINLMISGDSNVYDPSMTWRDIAAKWVGTSDANNWMLNVTKGLGVLPDSTLGDYVNAV